MAKKTVVLTGLFAPFEHHLGDDVEIWGCNRAYILQQDIPQNPDLTRLFFFDALERLEYYGHKDFVKHLNDMAIPVVASKHYPQIPLSTEFPLQEVMEEFRLLLPHKEKLSLSELMRQGKPYFTSTVTYMMALAIYEGFERVLLHRMQVFPQSVEYFEQKACMNFWCGIAIGRGIDFLISEDSHICTSHPWEPPLYGYIHPHQIATVDWIFSNAVQTALKYEHKFSWSKDLDAERCVGPGEKDILPERTMNPAEFIEVKPKADGTYPTPQELGFRPAGPIRSIPPKEKKGNGTKHP